MSQYSKYIFVSLINIFSSHSIRFFGSFIRYFILFTSFYVFLVNVQEIL